MGVISTLPSIRNRLTVLKGNREQFIKASDVMNLYHAIIKQGQFFLHISV